MANDSTPESIAQVTISDDGRVHTKFFSGGIKFSNINTHSYAESASAAEHSASKNLTSALQDNAPVQDNTTVYVDPYKNMSPPEFAALTDALARPPNIMKNPVAAQNVTPDYSNMVLTSAHPPKTDAVAYNADAPLFNQLSNIVVSAATKPSEQFASTIALQRSDFDDLIRIINKGADAKLALEYYAQENPAPLVELVSTYNQLYSALGKDGKGVDLKDPHLVKLTETTQRAINDGRFLPQQLTENSQYNGMPMEEASLSK
jgi:hypothetical protein